MGRVQLEKLLAAIQTEFSYNLSNMCICGEAAMVISLAKKECNKLILKANNLTVFNMFAEGQSVVETKHPVYGKVKTVARDNYNVIYTQHTPDWHCTEQWGSTHVETINTILFNLLQWKDPAADESIELCYKHGAYLLLEAWSSDLASIELNYGKYPEYYHVLEDVDGSQVKWRTKNGIEAVGTDYIFIEYIGMMYVVAS